jgi:SAM-dependent methyltransferase
VTLRDWNAVAPAWDEHFEWNAKCFQPLLEWIAAETDLRPGARLLDVAGGTGFPAIPLARRAPTASIVVTDISDAMVGFGARRAKSEGLTNVGFRHMDAHALAFGAASFDAVTCSFGLMLCEDPAKVVSEVRRVLVPGGRFAMTVWDTPTKNPFLAIFGRAIVASGIVERPERSDPGPFRLAEPGEFERVLREGGVTEFAIESRTATVTYASIDDYVAKGRRLAPNMAAKFAGITTSQLKALDRMVRAEAEPFLSGDGLRLTATALCATGMRD